MSQYPPQATQPYPPQAYPPQQKTSGAAITAMIMGLILCVPWLTGLGGIIFGAVGMSSTRRPGVGGRGMAITGIVLGLVNLAGWTGFTWFAISKIQPMRDDARSFIIAMSKGDVTGAGKYCHSTFDASNLRDSSRAMQTWGACQNVSYAGFAANSEAFGSSRISVSGTATFARTTKKFEILFSPEGSEWKIVKYSITD